jgi:zinc protease
MNVAARIVLLVLGIAVVTAGSARAAVFYPSSFTLANGLQVIVVPNRLSPAVSQMVWYKVGAADEKPGKTGLAHYLEHLMFRGSAAVAPGDFSKDIAAQGGDDNAFTSYDYTAYFEKVAADRLPMIMQMEAERMQHLRITPETASPELQVVIQERQQRTDNDPEGRFSEKLNAKFRPGHPYGRPVIGWKNEVEKLSVADAQKFYERYYAPNNAVVIISGDVKVDEVMRLAAATYGRVPKRAVPRRAAVPATPAPATHRFIQTDAGVEQAQIVWHFAAPSYATQQNQSAYATEIVAEALAGSEVGLLYRKLVTEEGLASLVDISYDPDARGDATLTIAAVPRPGQQPRKVQLALRAALAELSEKGLDAATVEAAKKRLQRAALFAREGLMSPGYAFGMALTTGHTVADVEEWPDRISAITPEQVNAALDALAATQRQTVGILLPDGKPREEGAVPAAPRTKGDAIR